MTNPPVTLPGYQIANPIYEGIRTLVYRGVCETKTQPVIIKFLRNEYPSFNELIGFRNQYIITSHLDSPYIVKPLVLERYGNGYALVMPDEGAISLGEYWQTLASNLTTFLTIAIQLTDALHYLNQQRIIHKDIKPANILIHPDTGQVQIIDFSIASVLPKQQQQLVNPKGLEGTLAYISPEQTGRMNRGIDYRTDFYSLGATFYKLLTGELPFLSEDPMELLHCHIAQEVKFSSPKDIPEVLQKIVLKLMEKNAEERYQSALGLKYDLEKCLAQYRKNSAIALFELGEYDICDRFAIPEKLYGRVKEVQALLDAFERVADGNREMMLVAGFSGIGKTAVVNEVHKPIVRQRGYFIKGKFDQFNRNIPFWAFVGAFRSLMGQILGESDAELADWKTEILEAVGNNGQVLIDVIPELEVVIGKQPSVPELSGSAAQNRFNLILQKFIKVFTKPEHPLVMFLDDLQWADSASLNLMKVLMGDKEKGYLLLLGAYRDNEVFPAHPLMLTLADLAQQEAAISTITLSPLSVHHINQLVAETLSCKVETSQPLTELVYQKTKGNPFFTTQFLQGLQVDGLIVFNSNLGYWECDLVKVRDAALTSDVVEFMAGRLQKLSEATQKMLKLAACIGNQFDLETLAIVSETSSEEVATALWTALQEGIILPMTEAYKFFQGEIDPTQTQAENVSYRFLHDRVQQAAYSLIPQEQKQATHYHIGKLLLQQTPIEAREENIFEMVNQLNYGTALITHQQERNELARLNLLACRKARAATAYQAGRTYANTGLSLLGNTPWQHQYEMVLEFHNLAAELAFLCGEFEVMEQFIERVLEQAHSLLEQVNVYQLRIQAKVSQNQLSEGISLGGKLLQQLENPLPVSPTQTDIQQSIAEIGQLIGGQDIEALIHLPIMTDAKKIAIMEIVNGIMPPAYISGSPLHPLLVFLSVKLSIQSGNTPASAFGYANYGIIACNLKRDVDSGTKFGQLALQVISKLNARTVKPVILFVVGQFILHRKSHIQETLGIHQQGYATALEVGNTEYVGYCAQAFCFQAFLCSQPLENLEQETRAYCQTLIQFNQQTTANWCRIYWQPILNLLGLGEHQTILSGEAFQEEEFLPQLLSNHDLFGLYFFHLYKLILCYLFSDITSAQIHGTQARQYLRAGTGTVGEPAFYFYDSLTILAPLNSSSPETSKSLQEVEQNQIQLQQYWAYYAPMNHQHKVDLVEAEKCRVFGEKAKAIEFYDRAIAGAKENKYIQEEALANELAAKFFLDWGKEKVAAGYMQEAYYGYSLWGAKAKITDLETRYRELLRPILQSLATSGDMLTTLTSLSGSTISVQDSTHYTTGSTSLNQIFDLASILKASQAISGTIKLDELLRQLTEIILQNSGGDRATLILPTNRGEWQVRAIATSEETQLCTEPLENNPHLPVKLIQYVKNAREIVVIDDLETDLPVVDNYLTEKQPKSLLCLPLLNQSRCIGILSLKNSHTSGVFTEERIVILNFICTQAAISLENARLYQKAQVYAEQLERSLKELQASHLQLMQSTAFLESQRESTLDGILVIDKNRQVAAYNQSFVRIWNVPQEVLDSKDDRQLLGCVVSQLEDPNEFIQKVDYFYNHPELSGFDEIKLKSGRFIERSTVAVKTRTDEYCGRVWYFRDISDRKQAQEAIVQKSQALETTLGELQTMQLQLVQNEKMATLGNLVAGVAHEINNPVGFIGGNISAAQEYLQDLLEIIALYQENASLPDSILEEIEDLDLEFITEDFPKLLASMQTGCDRIGNISTSLRTFSRTDTASKTEFNLYEGIDSTLLILKYRLKANENRPGIEVVKNYGEIPPVKCFPGQLNQVFMNLIANAIDALDESNEGKTYSDIEKAPNRITIATEFIPDDNNVMVRITDNGTGMPEEVRAKIFQQGFTTKGVGKGTGLGMAIARQIITEKHDGTISCLSELGQGTTFVIKIPLEA